MPKYVRVKSHYRRVAHRRRRVQQTTTHVGCVSTLVLVTLLILFLFLYGVR